jgi:predicted cupin superfamily sugar epimerase
MTTADRVIAALRLQPLPREGGYYRETYRSPQRLAGAAAKNASTAIYYLLTPDTCSALHRLAADEVYHFYLGDPVELLLLEEGSIGRVVTLGPDVFGGQLVQTVVPRGVWQGSCLRPGGAYALLGTTVAPGFDFADYEPADRRPLLAAFPEFADRIVQLTGEPPALPGDSTQPPADAGSSLRFDQGL